MLKVTTPALEQFKAFLDQEKKDSELFIRIYVNGFG